MNYPGRIILLVLVGFGLYSGLIREPAKAERGNEARIGVNKQPWIYLQSSSPYRRQVAVGRIMNGTAILKSDYGPVSLHEMTLKEAERLWGPHEQSQDGAYKSFSLRGILVDDTKEPGRFRVDTMFSKKGRLTRYSVRGEKIRRPQWLCADEDTINRARKPRDNTSASLAPPLFEKGFDRQYWIEKNRYPVKRHDMFKRFLAEHDLYTMTEKEILDDLGPPDRSFGKPGIESSYIYQFPHEGCVPYYFAVKLYLVDGKVKNWQFVHGEHTEPISPGHGVANLSELGGYKFFDLKTGVWPP